MNSTSFTLFGRSMNFSFFSFSDLSSLAHFGYLTHSTEAKRENASSLEYRSSFWSRSLNQDVSSKSIVCLSLIEERFRWLLILQKKKKVFFFHKLSEQIVSGFLCRSRRRDWAHIMSGNKLLLFFLEIFAYVLLINSPRCFQMRQNSRLSFFFFFPSSSSRVLCSNEMQSCSAAVACGFLSRSQRQEDEEVSHAFCELPSENSNRNSSNK